MTKSCQGLEELDSPKLNHLRCFPDFTEDFFFLLSGSLTVLSALFFVFWLCFALRREPEDVFKLMSSLGYYYNISLLPEAHQLTREYILLIYVECVRKSVEKEAGDRQTRLPL